MSNDFSNVMGGPAKPDFSNVQGGATTTSTATAATTAAGVSQTYTVVSGDSLSKIAKHFYGDMNAWHRIYDANRDKIKDPNMIHPGQVLTIPAAPASAPKTA